MNQYHAFIKIVETGSFSAAASLLGYTQSAVSQMVHSLEAELSTTLLLRSRNGVILTADGKEYLPYIQSISNCQDALQKKYYEMQRLQGGLIRIGTFTSVSRAWLPELMNDFKKLYPEVQFILRQDNYYTINQWILEGSVDFGFTNPDITSKLTVLPLCTDQMKAILPPDHPLANKAFVTLEDLAPLPFILLDEGNLSVPINAFEKYGLTPNTQYTVADDYTIMSMVAQGLGVSILYSLVLDSFHQNILIRPIKQRVERTLALAYKNKKTLPIASRYFIDYILKHFE